jgi:hypothetical protein
VLLTQLKIFEIYFSFSKRKLFGGFIKNAMYNKYYLVQEKYKI